MKKYHAQWSRRQFLSAAAGISSAMCLYPFSSWAIDGIDPKVAAIVAASISIDTHNHIDVPLAADEVPGPTIDLAGELRRSGFSAICMTFAVDYQKLDNSEDGYERFKNAMTSMDQQLANNGIKRSLNITDLQTFHRRHQPTVIQSIEGGHFLEGHIERLEEAYTRGLRHLTLLHDNDASVPLGDVYTKTAQWGGLTKFGAEVIRECNRLGILIDLAHADKNTVSAALKLAEHPIIISHTGLDTRLGQNPSTANAMKPRLISKEQAKIVADTGGIIGVWTHLADTPLEYAQNIRALVDVVGIDHVCIGTDTKLTPSFKFSKQAIKSEPQSSEVAEQKFSSSTKSVSSQETKRIGETTNQAWQDQKFGFYYVVIDALLKTGFTANEIGKIGGGNFCRVFEKATTRH